MQFTKPSNHGRTPYGQIHVRVRSETDRLYLDYHVGGARQRKHTGLIDSPANRQKVELLAAGTDLRPGEIAGLRWDDVNLDGCHLQVRQTYARRRFGAPKSAAKRREVRLTASAIVALREQSLRKNAAGDTVFQTAVRTPVDMKNFASRIWHPALQAQGLPRRRLYSTRHTFASLALAAGESPTWIARQLGHEGAQLLFRVYGHFVPRIAVRDGVAFERLLAVAAMPLRQMEINDAP